MRTFIGLLVLAFVTFAPYQAHAALFCPETEFGVYQCTEDIQSGYPLPPYTYHWTLVSGVNSGTLVVPFPQLPWRTTFTCANKNLPATGESQTDHYTAHITVDIVEAGMLDHADPGCDRVPAGVMFATADQAYQYYQQLYAVLWAYCTAYGYYACGTDGQYQAGFLSYCAFAWYAEPCISQFGFF